MTERLLEICEQRIGSLELETRALWCHIRELERDLHRIRLYTVAQVALFTLLSLGIITGVV